MKALVLISGGIDSIVASYLMKKLDLVYIHFDNRPFGDGKALEKCKKLIKLLKKKAKLYIVNYGDVHKEILECNSRYHCVFCKKLMYKISEKIAKKERCKFLITGENLGQVASQTLDNLKVIDDVDMTVLRPLLCYNKEEIINIARKIGSFKLSIMPAICCTALPKNPVTKAKLKDIKKEEEKIDIKNIIKNAVENVKLVTIN